MWAIAAIVCVLAGVIASVLGARAVAHNDASNSRQSFARNATGIAATLKLAIGREEELAVSASTYYGRNPRTSRAEFDAWVNWARTVHRFPELESLGLITLVRAPELAAYRAQISGQPRPAPATASGSGSTPTTVAGLPIVPSSDHHYFCLAVAQLARNRAAVQPLGTDYCALSPALLVARDAGTSIYTTTAGGHASALEVMTPVYRRNVTPQTAAGRAAASVGWLRGVLVPGVVLGKVLESHPGAAARLSFHNGSSSVAFASGVAKSGAQSTTIALHNGWIVEAFATPASASVFDNGNALALLLGGIALSVLVGLLVYFLGGARFASPPPESPTTAAQDLHDALTGLPNRALTMDRAERLVARARRQSGTLAGALLIDIDWFGDVNDKLGREAGDQLLSIVAKRLEGVVRTGDSVSRFGDDEFAVLVECTGKGAQLDSLARRVIEALHKPVELDGFGPSFYTTASIGVAFGRYDTPEDLLHDARLALQSAKTAGKDRYTLFNANMRAVIESRGVLEAELNTALQEKQFFVMYEPTRELGGHKVAALEAAIRWHHPKRGVLEPREFIELAEETGLIVPIGRWLLEEACNRGAAWNVMGRRVGVSVKVTANQLNREGFIIDVRRALQQSGLEPSLLTLEIAETTVMRDLSAAAEHLREVKQLGVRIAIEDFGGSGYARHSDLQRLPLDCLMVDENSLAASEDEDYRSWLLEAILIVGRELALAVIATSVETGEQVTALKAIGCTLARGSAMGQPVPTDAVESLLDSDAMPIAVPEDHGGLTAGSSA